MEQEIERLRHDIERHIAIASEHATECERLRAELASCREDAERYRWLRSCPELDVRDAEYIYKGLRLDVRIDDELAARKGEGSDGRQTHSTA